MMNRRLLVLLSCLIAGCVAPGDRRPDWPWPEPPGPAELPAPPGGEVAPGVPDPRGSQPAVQPTPRAYATSPAQESGPAVLSLLDEAEGAAARGELDQAAAILERAQRIEPRNPWVWQRLAQVRLTQGQSELAEQLALRSNSLARGNPYVLATNWGVIAEARARRGDLAGERQARAEQQRALSQTGSR